MAGVSTGSWTNRVHLGQRDSIRSAGTGIKVRAKLWDCDVPGREDAPYGGGIPRPGEQERRCWLQAVGESTHGDTRLRELGRCQSQICKLIFEVPERFSIL